MNILIWENNEKNRLYRLYIYLKKHQINIFFIIFWYTDIKIKKKSKKYHLNTILNNSL
jgi:hypothetical protein